jgi:hypothetical protein
MSLNLFLDNDFERNAKEWTRENVFGNYISLLFLLLILFSLFSFCSAGNNFHIEKNIPQIIIFLKKDGEANVGIMKSPVTYPALVLVDESLSIGNTFPTKTMTNGCLVTLVSGSRIQRSLLSQMC